MSTSNENQDRVQQASPETMNEKIEANTWARVASYRGKPASEISARIDALEKEWDIERYLGVNMSTLAMAGLAAAAFTRNRNWNILPGVVLAFFFQHSVQGWCPPLPILRLLKIRTRQEIEQERYALKLLRGDFNNISGTVPKDLTLIKQAIQRS